MSDISQIQVNGTTYDLCDATARTDIANLQDSVSKIYKKTAYFETSAIAINAGQYKSISKQIYIATDFTSVVPILNVQRWCTVNDFSIATSKPNITITFTIGGHTTTQQAVVGGYVLYY